MPAVPKSVVAKAAKAIYNRTPSAQSLASIGMEFEGLPAQVQDEITSLVRTVVAVLDVEGHIK
jgi:hypothetical protein